MTLRAPRRRTRGLLTLACVVLPLAAAAPAHAAGTCAAHGVTVTPLQTPVFYIDAATSYLGSYVGYRIANDGGATRADLWERLETFAGGVVAPAGGGSTTSALPVGDLAAGAAAPAYSYLKASAATTSGQTHDVVVYTGRPGAGGIELCREPQTIVRVLDVIKAAANKVSGASLSAAAVTLGSTFSLTVDGDTGTIGAGPAEDPGVVRFSPAVAATWPADAFRLVSVSHQLPLPGGAFPDLLARMSMSGPDRAYRVTYTFRVVGPTAAATQVVPVQNIASGTQVKHTDPSTLGSLAPIPKVTGTTSVTAAPGTPGPFVAGAVVPLRARFTNTGAHPVSIDEVVLHLPASWTPVPGSAAQDGTALADPFDAGGGVLHLPGPFTIPADGTSDFTLDATAGDSGVLTAEGTLVGGRIDATADPGDDAPATTLLVVLGSPVPPTPVDLGSTAVGTAPQGAQVTVPVGGSVTLLDGTGDPATSVTVPLEGRYDLAPDGAITFTPVLGFAGAAAGVRYRVTDAASLSGEARYVPVVTRPAPPAATEEATTAGGGETQQVAVVVPPGGTVTLLDALGAPVTQVDVPGVGTYELDIATRTIRFTPERDYTGTPAGVRYLVTDAYGQRQESRYVPTVTASSTGPATTTPLGPPSTTAAAPARRRAAARTCASRRTVRIHWKVDPALHVVGITVRQGARTPRHFGPAVRSALVDLRGLGRVELRVVVRATLAGGGTATASRTYRPCRSRLAQPPLETLRLRRR